MNPNDNELMHYGMPRRSGRYPWGSGDDPYQHGSINVLSRYNELKNLGLSEKEIAGEMGLFDENGNPSTGKLRLEKAYAKDEKRLYDIARAKSLQSDGKGATEIGREMGLPESTVRSLLNPELTASREKGLNYVAEGSITKEEYMAKLDSFVSRMTNGVKNLQNQKMLIQIFNQNSSL